MPILLLIAVPAVTLALILYSVAIWAERFSKSLKPWHVVLLWLGFVLDTLSSVLMARIAGGLSFNLHGFTGVFANTLMLIASIWATLALRSPSEAMRRNFHRYSLVLWAIWLVSFFTGMALSMSR